MNRVSIILPVFDNNDPILEILSNINNQFYKPVEVIIIDSSLNTDIQKKIKNFNSKIIILYHWVPKAYPGHARNIGVKLSKGNYVAFIDSKTIPTKNWLHDYMKEIINNNSNYKIGITEFFAKSIFQKLIYSASYGKLSFSTIPGSVFNKKFFNETGGFSNKLRSSEDQHFLKQLSFVQKKYYNRGYLKYINENDNFLYMLKKYFTYSCYTSFSNIQGFVKNTYLIIFLLVVPVLYPYLQPIFPNLFLNYSSIFGIVYYSLLYIISYNFLTIIFTEKKNIFLTIKFFSTIVLVFITFIVINWNKLFADWIQSSFFYIPHITKLYFLLIILFSIFLRGLVLPLLRNVENNFIFPFNWIKIGLLTLVFDITKSPAYIFGAIIFPFVHLYHYINRKN